MQATAHIGFIVAAYGAGAVVIVALIAWVMFDYRLQRRILAELETKGVSRRSARESAERMAAERMSEPDDLVEHGKHEKRNIAHRFGIRMRATAT